MSAGSSRPTVGAPVVTRGGGGAPAVTSGGGGGAPVVTSGGGSAPVVTNAAASRTVVMSPGSGINAELKLDLDYDLLNHALEKKLKKIVIDLLKKKGITILENQISFKNGSIVVVISNLNPGEDTIINSLNNDVLFKKLLENQYHLERCPCDPNDQSCKCNKKMAWWVVPLILFILFLIGLFVFVGIAVDYRK